MENAPTIILFWFWEILIFVFMTVFLIAAIIIIKRGKIQNDKRKQLVGKICLTLSIICSIPIILVVGYVLYISIF